MEENKNNNLEVKTNKIVEQTAINISKNAERIFNKLNDIDTTSLTYTQVAEMLYEIGKWQGTLEFGSEKFKQHPNYEQTLSRLNIMKNKLYQEVERKERGF